MLYFLINPSSSSGNGRRIWKRCAAILKERKIEYHPYFLKAPGDAGRFAADIASKAPCTVVIVGGDGTLNEFLTGLSSFHGITLACIPTGSANDFAKGMNLSGSPEELLEHILGGGKRVPIDVGFSSAPHASRPFLVSSGIGFDAAVCYAAQSPGSRLKKLLNRLRLGKLVYLVNALRMLKAMQLFPMELTLNGNEPHYFEKACFAAAMNTPFEGGGFMFAPDADPGDGLLDVIVAEGIPKWKILRILPTAFSGKHLRYPGIHLFHCSQAQITCQSEQCVHTDGEHLGFTKTLRFSTHEERLQFLS